MTMAVVAIESDVRANAWCLSPTWMHVVAHIFVIGVLLIALQFVIIELGIVPSVI